MIMHPLHPTNTISHNISQYLIISPSLPLQQYIINPSNRMNVDIDNFHKIRKQIQALSLIKECQLISFDLQFTGVKFDNNERDKYDMFLNDKYQKMSAVASKFNVVQVGVTFVIKGGGGDSNDNVYTAYPYNFYIFPRQSQTCSPTISMQAGCIQFNTAHNMDWNRWIKKGITYVRISDFNKHLCMNSNMNSITTITNYNSQQFGNPYNCKSYHFMLDELSERVRNIVEDVVEKIQGKDVGFRVCVEVPSFCVRVVRRAIQCYANQYSLDLIITKTAHQDNDSLHEEEDIDETKHAETVDLQIEYITKERKLDEIEKQKQAILGFSLIFQEIWNSNKPLVGHNCLYDILFLYSSFVDELPREYSNFKKIICQQNVRRFYDTKFIANKVFGSDLQKRGTSLEQLYKLYESKTIQSANNLKILLAPGFQAYDLTKPALHEAGFDSYLTAWVYLHLPLPPNCSDKLCIFKSYFSMNLKTSFDQFRQDLRIFVIAIVLNNAYIQFDELKNMRIVLSKQIRDELHKYKIANDVIVIDGFKEIFISMKDIANTDLLVKFLLALRKANIIKKNNLMSLEMWVKMRAEAQALVAAQTLTKVKSSDRNS